MAWRDVDWRKIRPYRDFVLAKADPRAKKAPGGILLPDGLTGYEKVSVEAATVLRVGSNVRKLLSYGLEPGERFMFRGFIKDLTWYMLQPAEDGTTVFLIHAKDLLAVIASEVDVGVFSGGPR